MSLLDSFLEDAKKEDASIDDIGIISKLATQQLELETKVMIAEAQLATAKDELRKVQEFLLPEAMTNVGMKKFTMANGFNVTIKDDILASIRADYKEAAYNWLEEHKLGGIIKDKVEVTFGKGDSELAADVVSYCQAKGYPVTNNQSVHAGTLKATIKEVMTTGVQFPEEMFSIHPFQKATIKTK